MTIDDSDPAMAVVNDAGPLQRMRDKRDGIAPCAQHLRQRL
ncbi:hypothetical protein [Bradyrhizobium amphicarpaeae]|nr:hypothetical protein [Bradyrhizobium amphicarpaeae]